VQPALLGIIIALLASSLVPLGHVSFVTHPVHSR